MGNINMFSKSDSVETMLGPGTNFKGNITSKGTVKLYGSVIGEIETDWLVTGEGSSVKGDVVAGGIIIGGSVEGNVTARERIELKRKGSIRGDIRTARLAVEDGSVVQGRIKMDGEGAPNQ